MTSGILVDFLFFVAQTQQKKTPKPSIDKIANGKTAIIEKKIYIQRRIFSNRLNQTPHHQSHRIAWLESQLYIVACLRYLRNLSQIANLPVTGQ